MRSPRTVALFLTLALGAAAPSAAGSTGHVNFVLGQKSLDSSDWEPLERQPEFGAEISWGSSEWPVLVATDFVTSHDSTTASGLTLEATTLEIDLGVRKIWSAGRARPYVGGGVALVVAEIELPILGVTVSQSESGGGGWLGGGVFWRLGDRFNLGLAARFTSAEVRFRAGDIEAGGTHLGLTLGWGWPAGR